MEQKRVEGNTRVNAALESQFPLLWTFLESVEPLSRIRDPNMTQNGHVYAIYCWLEVAGDVIPGENVKTIEAYTPVKFSSCWQ